MTPTEINVAIAKECGWTFKEGFVIPYGRNKPENIWFTPDGTPCKSGRPDYYHDLNACAEMEKSLSQEDKNNDRFIEMYEYQLELFEALTRDAKKNNTEYWVFSAPARIRAEAFLRTLGLWKGDK